MSVTDLPGVNAALNVTCTCFLLAGYWCIRTGRREAHKWAMIGACCVAAVFLTSYLIYHSQVGSVKFQGQGPVRTVYFAVLLSHTVLAASVPVLAGITVRRGLRGEFAKHRGVARWTLPIWLYVSVTGVIVYWMLYRM